MEEQSILEIIAGYGLIEVWRGVTLGSVLVAAAILLGVAAVSGFILRVVRQRAGSLKSGENQGGWALILAVVRKPLALALWAYGLYFAAVIVLSGETVDPELKSNLLLAESLAHAAGFIALFWLLFRGILAVEKALRQYARTTRSIIDDVLIPIAGRALRLVLPVVAAYLLLPLIEIPPEYQWVLQKLFGIFLIGTVAYLIIKSAAVVEQTVLREYRLDSADNLEARRLYTKISLLRKIIVVVTSVLALGCMLMLFDPVRQLGTSILASAGIAGIILGFAAQKTLGNLLAGVQIALTQPIRIDDVVIVEGEWGRIEEITLTYVVVRIWDLRRLVLPIQYFIENPFQNWTRHASAILGTVTLHADYRIPVDAVRAELDRVVKEHPDWDGVACGLQVTGCDRDTIELRCLASAADAGKAWNLRCDVRERLIAYLQREHSECLPRIRLEATGGSAEAAAAD